jgi:hypothetical protein
VCWDAPEVDTACSLTRYSSVTVNTPLTDYSSCVSLFP